MTLVGDRETQNDPRNVTDSGESPRAAGPGDRPDIRTGVEEPLSNPRLWDVAEVSAYLRVPKSAVYKMTARTATVPIPHIRLGGRLRFRRHDIDTWLSLLATSQPETLERIRRKALKVTHGHYP